MNIPRFKDPKVIGIINDGSLGITDKSNLIHDYDYDMCLRENSKPIYRRDLMSPTEIKKELEKWGVQ